MHDNELATRVIEAALHVHSSLGPGRLEHVYEACLAYELSIAGIAVARQVRVPLVYRGTPMGLDLRLDMLIERQLVVEVKAVSAIDAVHLAQALSYLRLSALHLALILNFNCIRMRDGIRRVIHGFGQAAPLPKLR